MEFDKSKVYTALNANESLIGAKGYFADTLNNLEYNITHQVRLMKVKCVNKGFIDSEKSVGYNFFYLVEPAPERWYVFECSDGSYTEPILLDSYENCKVAYSALTKEECDKWIAEHSKPKYRPSEDCDGLIKSFMKKFKI